MLKLDTPYAIDLGNGFAKRKFDGQVVVEPSILAEDPGYFSSGTNKNIMSYQDSPNYFIGDDVTKYQLSAVPALGEDDLNRYSSIEFKKLMYGFIAKDLKHSVEIPLLVTGLPVNHFKAKADEVKRMLQGKKIIVFEEKELVIDIKDVHVIPQPMGTYMQLVAEKKVNPEEDKTLIIDGGHGSLDVTEMTGYTITKRAGENRGSKVAHIEIYNYLVDKFGDLASITLTNIANLLEKGLIHDGSIIDIREMPEVKAILKRHFDSMFSFVRNNNFSLTDYKQVVFTGGIGEMHRVRIQEKKKNNFIIKDKAQEANVNGYYDYGKAVLAREKNTTVR
jgi:plasmid segregation protein ParM